MLVLIREGLITHARIMVHAASPEENLFYGLHSPALDLAAEQRSSVKM